MARKGTMHVKEIASKHLKETINIKIYVPEEFDSLYENHLCIMQDGDDYFQLGRVATVSDQLHEEDYIVNTVFAGIPYIDRYDRWEKYHPEGEKFKNYMLFLHEEVVPSLNEFVPLNPLGTTRTLIGDSLGATVSLLAALERPDLYKQVIMQSPYVDANVLFSVEQFTEGNQLTLYHSLGLNETEVPTTNMGKLNFIEPNKKLSALLEEKFPFYEYVEIAEGNHTWKYWQQEIPDIFSKMFA